jgi:acetyltransferase-like isoleucine patch superfamily enzyme
MKSSKLNTYGYYGLIKLIFSTIYTRLFFKGVRIFRLPIDIRNKTNINFGKNLTTGFGCRFEACILDSDREVLFFGNNVQVNDYVHITAMEHVEIGNNVLIASKVYISDCSHGSYTGNEFDSNPDMAPSARALFSKPVTIKDNVWLGEFVSVLPGVTIGQGTIVGANSVVSKSLPEYVIAVGIPARPIKKYNFETYKWERIKI